MSWFVILNCFKKGRRQTAMHHLSRCLVGSPPFRGWSSGCQDLVRFVAYHQIKPHGPPLVVSPRLFLWVSTLRLYFPGGTLNALASPLKGSTLPMASVQCWRPGLRRYLIYFATLAFVPQRQGRPSEMPSLLVFRSISTDFTPTPSVPFTSGALYPNGFLRNSTVKQWDFTKNLPGRLRTLYAQ